MSDIRRLAYPWVFLALLFVNGCEAFLTHRGGEGEPCFKGAASPCEEGLECNADGICVAASDCRQDKDCDDDIPCTQDRCASGSCQHQPDNSACDDNQFCNGQETCDPNHGCQSSGNPCPDGGSCDEDNDSCPGSPCGNGQLDQGEECDWGKGDNCCDHVTCKWVEAGQPDPDKKCSASNECRLAVCNGRGQCTEVNATDSTPCGDQLDTDCTAPDTCLDGICQPNHAPDGTPCGDEADTDCTDPDTCLDGICQPNHAPQGTACDSQAGDCVTGGQCDGQGKCEGDSTPVNDGTPCSDGFFCNGPGSCQSGGCEEHELGTYFCGEATCDEDADECCQLPTGMLTSDFTIDLDDADNSSLWGMLAGDFNADGILDLAVLRRLKNQVAILLGNGSNGHGDGTFTFAQDYSTSDEPYDLVSGDFNSDGITDLVVANHDNYILSYLQGSSSDGRATGQFETTVEVQANMYQNAVAAADFDSDGILDLAVVSDTNVAILLGGGSNGRGNGTFSNDSGVFSTPDTNPKLNDIVAADFTGDGILDLAVADGANNLVRVLPGLGSGGHGNGTFDADSSSVTPNLNTYPIDLAAGDINRDGNMDLVVAAYNGDKVDVLLGNGDGSFSLGTSISTGNQSKPRDVVLADFNADGNLDVAVANSDQSNNQVLVALGHGDGTFETSEELTFSDSPQALAAGDFDGDGDTDLAVVNWASDELCILRGVNKGSRADMTYDMRVDYSPCQGSTNAHGLALAHFNKDAINDVALAATCSGDAGAYILAGQGSDGRGNGTLQVDRGATIVSGVNENNGPTDLVAADFNNDSLTDLAVVTSESPGSSGRLHLLLANNFDDTTITLPGPAPFALIDGDFDEDGDTDLLVALGSTDDSIAVYHNDNGSLSVSSIVTPCPTNNDLAAVASGDFNADSITDVAVVCMGLEGNDILRFIQGQGQDGLGNGGFSTSQHYDSNIDAGCSSPNFMASGDFNADAATDVAVSCLGSNKVEILLGNKSNGHADGSFSHAALLDTDYSPNHIAVADLDADGILDLAVTCDYVGTNGHQSYLDVFRGNGDGSFAEKHTIPAPAGAERVAAGRINADAVPDLVVVSSAAGVVSVYFGGGVCY